MDVQEVWHNMPGGSRSLVLLYPTTLLMSYLMESFARAVFFFSPHAFLTQGHFWTLATSAFAALSAGSPMADIINLLFTAYMILALISPYENEFGTALFLLCNLYWSVMCRLAFLCMLFLAGQILQLPEAGPWSPFGSLAEESCMGLWPTILVFISLRSYSDLAGKTNFFGLVQIPNKYYPLFLFCVFSLFNQRFLASLFPGILVGFMQGYLGWKLDRFMPTTGTIARLEGRCPCPRSLVGGRYIPAGSGAGLQRVGNWLPAPGTSTSGNRNFAAFAGVGQRLGTGQAEPLLRTEA